VGIPIVALDAVPVGGGVIVTTQHLVVTRPTEDEVLAFYTLCPHRGCQVRAVAAGTINCFCHGSRFRIGDGAVVGGPAEEPLTPVAVAVIDGMVVRAAG
jgi:nitrite reductase/ring-hydroxylating ferredoxin subunit